MKNFLKNLNYYMGNKKSLLLFIFIVVMNSFYSQNAKAQSEVNWENQTPPPCTNVFGSERDLIPWVGPKSLRVCPNGPNGCCFTIVYHDKMFKVSGLDSDPICTRKYDYDVSITGVFYEDVNCKNFDKDILFNYFLDKLYRLNSTRKGFRDSLTKCCNMSIPNSYGYLQTKYKCVDINNVLCAPTIEGCCNTYKRALFRSNGNDCEFVGIDDSYPTEFNGPTCQSGCTPNCNIIEMKDIRTVSCDKPCNFEPWENKTISVPFDPACPTCTILITYRYRETKSCSPNYFDFELDRIWFDNENCDPCMPNGYDVLTPFAISQMLSVFIVENGLEANTCIENVRISKAPCFGVFFNNPGQDYVGECVPADECCLAILKICADRHGIPMPPVMIYNNITNTDTCDVPMLWCKTFCFDEMFASGAIDLNSKENQINAINQAYFIKPNPAKTYIDLTINNNEKGDFTLNIYNQSGAIVKTEVLQKNKLLQSYIIDVRSLNSGNYNLVILHNNKDVFKSLINIEK